MAKSQPAITSFAALVFDIGANGVTNEAHLLPTGNFRADDGRPTDCANWQLSPDIATNVISRMAAKSNDTLIDYEHQSLRSEDNGQPVPAAGWFKQLEYRADGLWATDIAWTDAAKQHISAKQYRYISAVFLYYKATGEILEIISLALTNTPAIDGLNSLAALSKYQHDLTLPTGDKDMAKETEELAALTTSVASLTASNAKLTTEVAALATENDALKAQAATAEADKVAAALAADKTKHAEVLAAALTAGTLAPAQKAWAEKLSLAALTEFLATSKPLLGDNRQHQGGDQGGHGLSAEELAMCSRMGVTPEAYIKTQALAAARKAPATA